MTVFRDVCKMAAVNHLRVELPAAPFCDDQSFAAAMQVVRTAHSSNCRICVNVVVDAAHVSYIDSDITRLLSLPGRYIASLKISLPRDATEPSDAESAVFGDAHRRVTRTVAAALSRGKLSRRSTELRASAIGRRSAHLDMRGLAITNRLIEWLNEEQSSCAILG